MLGTYIVRKAVGVAVATGWESSPRAQRAARRSLNGFPTKVVQIGGASRSGTTLLELVLADRLGAVSVGEVRHVFQRGIIENQRCSCGDSFWDCSWWASAADSVFGGREAAVARATKVVDQGWSTVRSYPGVRSHRAAGLTGYESIVGDLFTVLAEQAGGRWLIDSSKNPSWFEVVGRVAERAELVHVVRDVRGVVASNRRQVRRPEITDRVAFMPRSGVVRTVAEWSVFNVLTAMAHRSGGYRMVRYEDLCADSVGTIDRLAFEIAPGERGRTPVFHSVSGNPMRFRTTDPASVEVRLDDQWRRELPSAVAASAAVLAWPAGRIVDTIAGHRSRAPMHVPEGWTLG